MLLLLFVNFVMLIIISVFDRVQHPDAAAWFPFVAACIVYNAKEAIGQFHSIKQSLLSCLLLPRVKEHIINLHLPLYLKNINLLG